MGLSDFEIQKITEIVAGKVDANLDAKALRKVIDSVVDNLKTNQGNPQIESVTCDVDKSVKPFEPKRSDKTFPTFSDESPSYKRPETESAIPKGGLYSEIKSEDANRVIIATFGKNRPGVIAAITQILAELNCSIEDISQTLMQEFFSMIMVVNTKESTLEFSSLRDKIQSTEGQLGMKVYVMHEDIFKYMHRI